MSADAARQELAATGANLAARIRGPSSLAAALATLRYHVTRGTLPPEVHLAAAIILQELDATGVFADAPRREP
ncbi:MAG TPA: hypothetical protein VFQ22_07965 [Longimicrobiales bacterium]|nr:hypothetical protein [Longimicrobiales bacterium]